MECGWDDALRAALALVPVRTATALRLVLGPATKLVSLRTVALALWWARRRLASATESMRRSFGSFTENPDLYIHFGAPVVEELAKGAFWIFLIATARVAFMVDSAICGFAVGAGFALVENISYLEPLQGRGLGVWLLRGFGTAVMHGGVAAIGAFISVYLSESRGWHGVRQFAPGLLVAMMLHSLFNQGVLSPAESTAVTVAGS